MKESVDILKNDIKAYYKPMLLMAAVIVIMNLLFHRVCPLAIFTGIPCPGCGMTRALGLLLTGHFQEAFQMHPMIYPVAFLTIVFAVRRYVYKKKAAYFQIYILIWCIIAIGLYAYRMAAYFPDTAPMEYDPHNVVAFMRKLLHLKPVHF